MTDTRSTEHRAGFGTHLWSALKSALVDEDPMEDSRRARRQDPDTSAANASAPGPGATTTASSPAPGADVAAAMSPMARALRDQVLAKATAYTALTEKLAQLEPVIADERTRYQAAYALIRGSRSVEQVVQSIDMQHVQALEAEAARFAAQLQEKERVEIGTRTEEARTLGTHIDAAAQDVARLREDVEARIRQIEQDVARDRERLAEVTKEIDAKRQELAGVQRQFDAAAGTVKAALAAARGTVLRHLGG